MILVTGGTGFIGSHICFELMNSGYEVVVVDNYSNSSPESISRIQKALGKDCYVYGVNLQDKLSLEKIFSKHAIEAVIHLAGLKSVNESIAQPLKYYRNNVVSTITLLEVMNELNVKKIVFSSSATVYGNPKVLPVREDAPLNALNPYGKSKVFVEEILNDVYQSNPEWSISILRYFNPVGAHENGLIGEDSQTPPSNLMPLITQVAIGLRNNLDVYGNDYNTVDGTAVRDFIHVVDLAKGHIKALEHIKSKSGISVYNLGTGIGHTVMEIIECFERVNNVKIPYVFEDRRKGDIECSYADPSKANKELDWKAEKSIEDMCRDAWNWELKRAAIKEK